MEDHQKNCRLCLSPEKNQEEKVLINQEVLQKIVELIKFEFIQTRNYSNFICRSCFTNLEAFSTFRSKIIGKQKELGFYLCRIKNELAEAIEIKVEKEEEYEQEFATETIVIKNEILPDDNYEETPHGSEDDPCDESQLLEEIKPAAVKAPTTKSQGVKLPIIKKGSLYHCELCDKKYAKRIYAYHHLASKHSIGVGRSKTACEICGKLVFRGCMKIHAEKTHDNITRAECDICGKKFYNKTVVQVHVQTHIPAEHRAKHQCDICSKSFSRSYCLEKHKMNHHEQPAGSFACHCGKVFNHQSYLKQHIRTIHIDTSRDANCKYCGKAFRRHVVRTHEKRVHEKKLEFVCEHEGCDKKFYYRDALNKHFNFQHLHKRPFVCSYPGCTKAYSERNRLVIHNGVEHLKLRENCPIKGCKFSVGRRHYMTGHLKKHVKLNEDEIQRYRKIIFEMNLV